MIIDIGSFASLFSNIGSWLGVIFIIILVTSTAVKIVPEYKRLVIFRLGRLAGSRQASRQVVERRAAAGSASRDEEPPGRLQ